MPSKFFSWRFAPSAKFIGAVWFSLIWGSSVGLLAPSLMLDDLNGSMTLVLFNNGIRSPTLRPWSSNWMCNWKWNYLLAGYGTFLPWIFLTYWTTLTSSTALYLHLFCTLENPLIFWAFLHFIFLLASIPDLKESVTVMLSWSEYKWRASGLNSLNF